MGEMYEFGTIRVRALDPEECRSLRDGKCKSKNALEKHKKSCKGCIEECKYYRKTYVPETEKEYNFDVVAEQAEILAYCIRDNINCNIIGPAGVGKSTLPRQIAALLNWPVIRFSCSAESRWTHIFGQWVLSGGDMFWEDGYILDAFRNGKMLIEEEADFMLPELRASVHTIMEQGSNVVIHGRKDGKIYKEVIRRHPNFRWISTGNTKGYVESFEYAGTQLQNQAARDRYGIIVEMDYVGAESEIEIVMNHLKARGIKEPNKDNIEKFVKIANDCRKAKLEKKFEGVCSYRRTIEMAYAAETFEPERAARHAFINFLLPADQLTVINLIKTEFEGTVSIANDPTPITDPNI